MAISRMLLKDFLFKLCFRPVVLMITMIPTLSYVATTCSSFDETDEMCWGGAWLYLATGDTHYLKVAEDNYTPGAAWGQSWDEKLSGCMVNFSLYFVL